MGNKLKRTDAAEWRTGGDLVELPSGKVAELKRLSVVGMLRRKKDLPNFLLTKLSEGLNGVGMVKKKTKAEGISTDDAFEAMVWLAKECFVYPTVVEEPDSEHEISVEDISLDDLTFVMNYAIGDLGLIQTVDRFHGEQNGSVEPIPAGADVDNQAE